MENNDGSDAGLARRVMKEILDTPALKEVLLLHMRGIRTERARGLAGTLLWEDPAISMSLMGSLPDAANWMLTLLAELGEQLESIPPPLLREILADIASRLDRGKLEEAFSSWSGVVRGLAVAKEAEGGGAPLPVHLLNAAIARLDRATMALEDDPEGAARALAGLLERVDTAGLRRSLRRLSRTALRAVRAMTPAAHRPHAPKFIGAGRSETFPGAGSMRRFMYGWNTFFCLTLGPLLMLRPGLLRRFLRWPGDDPVMTGIYGSIVTSVGILSAAALTDESKGERFLPLFQVQLLYKAMTCLMLRRELRRRKSGKLGLRVFFWFFLLYIALLAGALGESKAAGGFEAGSGREGTAV